MRPLAEFEQYESGRHFRFLHETILTGVSMPNFWYDWYDGSCYNIVTYRIPCMEAAVTFQGNISELHFWMPGGLLEWSAAWNGNAGSWWKLMVEKCWKWGYVALFDFVWPDSYKMISLLSPPLQAGLFFKFSCLSILGGKLCPSDCSFGSLPCPPLISSSFRLFPCGLVFA